MMTTRPLTRLMIPSLHDTVASRNTHLLAHAPLARPPAHLYRHLAVGVDLRLHTHGVHVTMGLIWIVVLGAQVALKGLTMPVASRLYRLGLFWHFLDIAWVGIFSIVYLPGLL